MLLTIAPFVTIATLLALHAPALADTPRSPAEVVRHVLEIDHTPQLPDWSYDDFDARSVPYLIREFRAANRRGKSLGGRYNILDGDLFTGGGQMLTQTELAGSPTGPTPIETTATLHAAIEFTDGSRPLTVGPKVTFWLKKEDGVWKIDDLMPDEEYIGWHPTMKHAARQL